MSVIVRRTFSLQKLSCVCLFFCWVLVRVGNEARLNQECRSYPTGVRTQTPRLEGNNGAEGRLVCEPSTLPEVCRVVLSFMCLCVYVHLLCRGVPYLYQRNQSLSDFSIISTALSHVRSRPRQPVLHLSFRAFTCDRILPIERTRRSDRVQEAKKKKN